MKIKITPVPTYQVEIDGIEVGCFSVESEWNGLTCLKSSTGDAIIANIPKLDLFANLIIGGTTREGDVVSANPSLIAIVKKQAVPSF